MSSTPSPSSNGDSSPAVAIVTSIVGAIVVIAVTYFIVRCMLIRMRLRYEDGRRASGDPEQPTATVPATTLDSRIGTEPVEKFLKDILKEKPMRFTPQDLENFTQNYGQVLGSGGFGVVYKGQFLNGLPMAVKLLNSAMSKRAEEQFVAEIGTIGRTYHINLVKLYGFCFDTSVKALVYEYMENGSLDKFLFNDDQRIEWGKLHEIAVGTAKGIRYLHEECQHKIVHYDIKPANVLLTANFTPKVADFGLAKFCDREGISSVTTLTGARGTPGYAAPELWMPIPVTHKCDVYSFGMLLFEILGRRRNLSVLGTEQSQELEWFPLLVWTKFEEGNMESIISSCGIGEKDREKAERMCQVALWCVQYKPEERPAMNSVVRMLEGEQEIVPPTHPFHYMTSVSASSVSGITSGTAVTDSTGIDDSNSSSVLERPLI
ncbi:rust resistance kinase Lr10-like [Zingiber officinale]|uniref:rust resistance kinase Lr10-like n=1 Tax=Zingiber officinale TaxID=94328 RepID=UPI001C4BBC34|nr:rust resistance kinase Lr10-like [Zingiber officinale]